MKPDNADESGFRSVLTISFVALLVGQVISILGDRLNNIALIELLSTETARFGDPRSAFELSKLAVAMTLPSIALGPLAGAYVDRVSRKRVLVTADVLRGVTVLAIPFMRPSLPLWAIYLVVAVLYLVNLFFLPARCAIVFEIVPRDRLIKANSLLSLGATTATIVGFGLGGVVASKAGWRIAMFIDSATYFLSAVALSIMRVAGPVRETQSRSTTSYLRVIGDALSIIRKLRGTRAGVLAPTLLATGGTLAYVLGVAIVESTRPQGTMVIGVLVGLAGLGMALGCYVTGRVLHATSRTAIAAIGTPLAFLFLMVPALTGGMALVGAGVALAGFVAGPVFVSSETAIQEEAPPRRQATVFALRDMMMKIAVAGSAIAAAGAATTLGYRTALLSLLAIGGSVSLVTLAARRR